MADADQTQGDINAAQSKLNAETLALLRELTLRLVKVEQAFVQLSHQAANVVALVRAQRESAESTKH